MSQIMYSLLFSVLLFSLLIYFFIDSLEFHIKHPNISHIAFFPYHPLTPLTPTKRKQNTVKKQASKQKQKQPLPNQNNNIFASFFHPAQHLSIHPGGTGGFSVSYSTPRSPFTFTSTHSLQWITGLVQGLWFLIHHHHWVLIETPLGYPVVLSRGDPEVINQ